MQRRHCCSIAVLDRGVQCDSGTHSSASCGLSIPLAIDLHPSPLPAIAEPRRRCGQTASRTGIPPDRAHVGEITDEVDRSIPEWRISSMVREPTRCLPVIRIAESRRNDRAQRYR